MTKKFCDICGKPALDVKFASHRIVEDERTRKTYQIVASVNFGCAGHPGGFIGPPDLCDVCAQALVCTLSNILPVEKKEV